VRVPYLAELVSQQSVAVLHDVVQPVEQGRYVSDFIGQRRSAGAAGLSGVVGVTLQLVKDEAPARRLLLRQLHTTLTNHVKPPRSTQPSTLRGMIKRVTGLRAKNGAGECTLLGLWFKPIGLNQRSAATWRCAAFIA